MRKLITAIVSLSLLGTLPALGGWDEGVAAFTAKNFQSAASEFKELVRQNPDGWRGHYMLGLTLEQMKSKEEALHHLRKAYDLNPNDLSVKMALGRAYKNLRRYGDVNKLLGSVDASSLPAKQRAAFYQIRGEAKHKTGNSQGAVSDFEQLARLRSTDAKTQYLYGTSALAADQLDKGITALDKAAGLAPNDADIMRAYAQALIKKGRVTRDKTVKKTSYLKASKLATTLVGKNASYDNLMLKISAELGAGLYDQAVGTGKQAVGKNSNDWLPHYYLGQAYTSAKQYQEAEAPLNTALGKTQKPNDQKLVWKQLGYAFEKQKKYTQSIDAYQRAGDQGGMARVKENQDIQAENKEVEEHNTQIKAMEEEAKKLEEELKRLEGGGGMR